MPETRSPKPLSFKIDSKVGFVKLLRGKFSSETKYPELRRNSRYDAMSRRLSHLWCLSVSGGTAAGGGKDMRAAHPHTPRQARVTRTPANRVCRLYKIFWCRCFASAAVQPRRLVAAGEISLAGAVQSAQWRELDLSSSRATAESPVVMRYARRLSELRSSSVSGGTAAGRGKGHEGCAPSYSAAGESHLHLGKQVCRLQELTRHTILSLSVNFRSDRLHL